MHKKRSLQYAVPENKTYFCKLCFRIWEQSPFTTGEFRYTRETTANPGDYYHRYQICPTCKEANHEQHNRN